MATRRRLALLATLALAAGCSKPAPTPVKEAAPAAAPAVSTGNATIVGHGPRPNPGAQIVVVLEPTTSRTFPPQTEVPVMDQVGLTFGPPLLLVRTGQPVEFRNSDDTLHNVHVTHEETREPAFNVAIPTDNSYSVHISEGRLLSGRMRHPPGDGGIGLFCLDAVRDARGARRAVHDRRCRAGRLHRDGVRCRENTSTRRRGQQRRRRRDHDRIAGASRTKHVVVSAGA